MNPEQLTSTPTKQDLLNEEIHKLALQIHLEVQSREDIRRDLAERMQFLPPDLRAGEHVCYWPEDPSKIHQGRISGKWLKVEIIAVKGIHGSCQHRCDHVSGKHTQAQEDRWTLWIWKNFRTRVSEQQRLYLWLSCEGQIDIWEVLSDNSYLGAILDRRGLQVAAPIDLDRKKAESFSPQLSLGFWHKLKKKNPRIGVMSCSFRNERLQEGRNGMATVPSVYGRARASNSWRENTSLNWDQKQERFGG